MNFGSSNNAEAVKAQYSTTKGLNTRISFHETYSTSKENFGDWIVSNYDIKEGMRVLELGCGTGVIWVSHKDLIAKCKEFVLTDFSEAMLKEASDNLSDCDLIEYKKEDIQNLSFKDKSFDVVIANFMLYHIPDLPKAISEVRRVLKDDGVFYCATFGEHNFTDRLADWFNLSGESFKPNHNFTLDNGEKKLKESFSQVETLRFKNSLRATDADALVDYMMSLASLKVVTEMPVQKIKDILKKHETNGAIDLPKDYGMFVARN